MSYDFCIEQLAVPADAEFPMDVETWAGESPVSKSIEIEDRERFWHRISTFPNMVRNGPNFHRTWIFRGIRHPGGFMVYPVYNIPPNDLKEQLAKTHSLSADGATQSEILAAYDDLAREQDSYGVVGIKLDMSGSWYDVLQLYEHLIAEFPRLVVFDEQTGTIYDGASFRKWLENRGAR